MEETTQRAIIAFGLNNIGCDQSGATFQTILPAGGKVPTGAKTSGKGDTEEDGELCHFIYPGLEEEEALKVHRQIKDVVRRFGMKDICAFLKRLADDDKLLLPQVPQNAFDELHRMGMPSQDVKGFGYDNFCKYYRK